MRDGFIRASDAERDQAARRLRDHAVAGRLTTEELDERSGRVFAARTLGELDDLFHDLPRERGRSPRARRAHARPAAVARTAPRCSRSLKLATASVVALVLLQGLIWMLIGLALASIAVLWLLICVGTQLAGSAATGAAALRAARSGRRPGLTA